MQTVIAFFTSLLVSLQMFFPHPVAAPADYSALPVAPPASAYTGPDSADEPVATPGHMATSSAGAASQDAIVRSADASSTIGFTEAQLLALADDALADGTVPLGDNHYVTDAPKKGYVYLCNVRKENPGSAVNGPWIHGSTWNYLQKVTVDGTVSWPNAKFSNVVSGMTRVLSGNGLPVGYPTGVFPVAASDDAHQYDPNPNTISAQTVNQKFPAHPTYSETPYCMGMEVGVMTDGVPLFNSFDAGLRDAPAHELQDSCDGHPQGGGEYHYHGLSNCFKDIRISTVLGYALDGFPITGPEVVKGKYLTTDDLDACHGITSEVVIDGKKTMTYHYVMTRDFPYSVSCFRGKPVSLMVIAPQNAKAMPNNPVGGTGPALPGPQQSAPPMGAPPQSAIDACSGKAQGVTCSMATPMGDLSGHCDTPPNTTALACVPR